MAAQLVLATLLAGLASFLIIARRLRAKSTDDVHRLQSPVRSYLLFAWKLSIILQRS